MSEISEEKKRKSGRWVLLWFLGFFGVIILLDSIFVYLAVNTRTGLVTEHAYEKGLAHGKRE